MPGALLCLLVWAAAPVVGQGRDPGWREAIATRGRELAREFTLPRLAVVLATPKGILWASAFGSDSIGNDTATVYRAGSLAKTVTALAVMQLAAAGKLDLDAPVRRYLPGFRPRNPYGGAITLRRLLEHRSGLDRDPPAGGYLDSLAPPLDSVVRSLNGTTLRFAPGSRTKYSNAGPTVAGLVVERVSGEPYASYVRDAILAPSGMGRSGIGSPEALAGGWLWAPDRERFAAPSFRLGIAPAAGLYASAADLGRFAAMLLAGGTGPGGQVVDRATLRQMWSAPAGDASGYALGFQQSSLDGRFMVGHAGAVYGYTSILNLLPDDSIGVVVVTDVDAANGVVAQLAQFALRAVLADRTAGPPPIVADLRPVGDSLAHTLAGRYSNGAETMELQNRGGALSWIPAPGRPPLALSRLADTLAVNDLRDYGPRLVPSSSGRGRLVVGGDTLARVQAPRPGPLPARWQGIIGEYGPDYGVVFLYEAAGRLMARTEWFNAAPLEELAADRFRFPRSGMHAEEELAVLRGPDRSVTGIRLGGVWLPRRRIGPAAGGQLHVHPVRPVEELRQEALQASPPAQPAGLRPPDLVNVAALDSSIHLDIRYAGANNFLGTPFYTLARAFLQRPAAMALLRAHHALRRYGYGILIHDAYRPWYVTKIFWDATPDSLRWLVANPANGSRHNRGAAVDVTMYDLATGRPVPMPGTYDESTDRSFAYYPGGTDLERWNRGLLRRVMEAQGFAIYPAEWWHFDYGEWREYPILNIPFEQIGKGE